LARSLTGTRIRERRRGKKLSQTELARQVGISASYLNLIEHNRRGIAGKTLLAIAENLGVDARSLSEGADQAHIMQLREAAANAPAAGAELDRLEEFVGRFPGWARLIDTFQSQSKFQNETLLALSDRLKHDPFFAEAIHMMVSNITAIHATVGILSDDQDVPPDMRRMFLDNLSAESARLAKTASDLIGHFDTPDRPEQVGTQSSAVDRFFEKHGFHLAGLESGDASVEELLKEAGPLSDFDRADLAATLSGYQAMARALPLGAFLDRCRGLAFDPLRLAAEYSAPLETVFLRLAHLPLQDGLPEFGFLKVDGSGGVLYRKQLSTLNLPKFSSGCPLWPVYRCFGQPGQPVRAMMNTATGESFLTFSVAKQQPVNEFGLPPSLTASMIFTTDFARFLPKAERQSLAQLEVGLHCTVCPRLECPARRSGYILG
jgi:predicted transcriptional regulator/DNA-binding XRE family transcriptional regulator